MKRKRSPHEKKQLSYEKDHRRGNHHGFWRDWRRIKAGTNRVYRKRVRALLDVVPGSDSASAEAFEDAVTREAVRKSVERPALWKPRADTLRAYVHAQLQARTQRIGLNKKNRAIKREGYAAFVRSLLGKRRPSRADITPLESKLRWWDFREFLNQHPETLTKVEQWYKKAVERQRQKDVAIQHREEQAAKWRVDSSEEVLGSTAAAGARGKRR